MTLREIAENLTQDCPEPARRYIKTLLNAVVEERQRYLHAGCTGSECTHWEDNHHIQAINELNLKDVWPGKENNNDNA